MEWIAGSGPNLLSSQFEKGSVTTNVDQSLFPLHARATLSNLL